jgi:hypothetical protein
MEHFCVAINQHKMLRNISWSEFILVLVAVLSIYYLYVILVYFGKDITRYFHTRTVLDEFPVKKDFSPMPVSPNSSALNGDKKLKIPMTVVATPSEIEFSTVHDLLEDLKSLFAVAAKTSMIKQELVQALNGKLKNYPMLNDSDVRDDINVHIIEEVREKCGIELVPEDIKRLWRS